MQGSLGRAFVYHGGGNMRTAFSAWTDFTSITGLDPAKILYGSAAGGIEQKTKYVINALGLGVNYVPVGDETFAVGQRADYKGISLYGFDDMSGDFLRFYLDSAGFAFSDSTNRYTLMVGGVSKLIVTVGVAEFDVDLKIVDDEYVKLGTSSDWTIGLPAGETEFVIANSNGLGTVRLKIDTNGNVLIPSNTAGLLLGLSQEMEVYFDGVSGNIDVTLLNGGADLIIDCGANKTLELETPVYRDINVGGVILTVGAVNAPDKITVDATGIVTWGFDGGALQEILHGGFEIDHFYKQNTDLIPHVHWYPVNANAGNVKWFLEYWIRFANTVKLTAVISVVDAASGVAWAEQRADFPTIVVGTLPIGAQVHFALYRVPTDVQDTYGSDAALGTFGIHLQVNTLGSRQIITK